MQAHVLELNVDRILDAKWMDGKAEGIVEGKALGKAEGRIEGKVELLVQMGRSTGQSDSEIVKNVVHFLEVDEQQACQLFEQYSVERRAQFGRADGPARAPVTSGSAQTSRSMSVRRAKTPRESQ